VAEINRIQLVKLLLAAIAFDFAILSIHLLLFLHFSLFHVIVDMIFFKFTIQLLRVKLQLGKRVGVFFVFDEIFFLKGKSKGEGIRRVIKCLVICVRLVGVIRVSSKDLRRGSLETESVCIEI
jgi:hypothetical protein